MTRIQLDNIARGSHNSEIREQGNRFGKPATNPYGQLASSLAQAGIATYKEHKNRKDESDWAMLQANLTKNSADFHSVLKNNQDPSLVEGIRDDFKSRALSYIDDSNMTPQMRAKARAYLKKYNAGLYSDARANQTNLEIHESNLQFQQSMKTAIEEGDEELLQQLISDNSQLSPEEKNMAIVEGLGAIELSNLDKHYLQYMREHGINPRIAEETYNDLFEKIRSNERMSDEQKEEAVKRLNNVIKDGEEKFKQISTRQFIDISEKISGVEMEFSEEQKEEMVSAIMDDGRLTDDVKRILAYTLTNDQGFVNNMFYMYDVDEVTKTIKSLSGDTISPEMLGDAMSYLLSLPDSPQKGVLDVAINNRVVDPLSSEAWEMRGMHDFLVTTIDGSEGAKVQAINAISGMLTTSKHKRDMISEVESLHNAINQEMSREQRRLYNEIYSEHFNKRIGEINGKIKGLYDSKGEIPRRKQEEYHELIEELGRYRTLKFDVFKTIRGLSEAQLNDKAYINNLLFGNSTVVGEKLNQAIKQEMESKQEAEAIIQEQKSQPQFHLNTGRTRGGMF